MKTSEQLADLAAAMAKAQGAIEPASKDRTNPAFRSRYADLTSVWEAARKAITSNGLSVIQEVVSVPEGIAVITRIQHASGQWMELGPTPIPVGKKDAQGVGSAITYGKRYALCAAFGVVADDDDDGNAASGRRPERQQQQPEQPQQPPATLPPTAPAKAKVPAAVIGELSKRWAKELNGGTTSKEGFIAFALHHLAPAEAVDLTKPSAWDMEAVQIVSDAITHSSQAEAA